MIDPIKVKEVQELTKKLRNELRDLFVQSRPDESKDWIDLREHDAKLFVAGLLRGVTAFVEFCETHRDIS